MRTESTRYRERGFTLVEMLVTLAVLTIVLGVAFDALIGLQRSFRSEDLRVDVTEASRNFMDQFARDLHQSGYPPQQAFLRSALGAVPINKANVAVGIVQFSPTSVWFEGDVDGDGHVESVRYAVQTQADGSCPCTVERASIQKVDGTAPLSQPVSANLNTILDGVLNEGATISGSTRGTANDSLYAAYKTPLVFKAFDKSGVPVSSCNSTAGCDLTQLDGSGNPITAEISSIRVNVNAWTEDADPQTGRRSVLSLQQSARVQNTLP